MSQGIVPSQVHSTLFGNLLCCFSRSSETQVLCIVTALMSVPPKVCLLFHVAMSTYALLPTEDPVETLQLKRLTHPKDPKRWMAYVNTFIVKKGMKGISNEPQFVTAIHYLNKKLIFKYLLKKQSYTLSSKVDTGSPDFVVVYPIFLLEIRPPVKAKLSTGKWKWTVEKSSAVIFHINQLRLFSLQQSRCKCNFTVNYHKLSSKILEGKIFLCGIYSNVSLYVAGHKIESEIFYCFINSFAFSVLLNTFSAQSIESSKLWEVRRNGNDLIRTYHTLLLFNNRSILLYHIITEKCKTITVFIPSGSKAQYFDGPGLLSECSKTRVNAVKFVTFQGVIQVHSSDKRWLLNYSSTHNVDEWERYAIKGMTNHTLTIAHDPHQCNNAKVCIRKFHVETADGKHVNIAFSYLHYVGDNGTDCLFGGVALFDATYAVCGSHRTCKNEARHFRLNESSTICTSVVVQMRNMQSFYSLRNSVVLVVYSYSEYSTLGMKLVASQTSCQAIKVNLCALCDFHYMKFLNWQYCLALTKTKCILNHMLQCFHSWASPVIGFDHFKFPGKSFAIPDVFSYLRGRRRGHQVTLGQVNISDGQCIIVQLFRKSYFAEQLFTSGLPVMDQRHNITNLDE